jgi:hypothetical protein
MPSSYSSLAVSLVFGETEVALVFSILNGAMLYWRIRERRGAGGSAVLAGAE